MEQINGVNIVVLNATAETDSGGVMVGVPRNAHEAEVNSRIGELTFVIFLKDGGVSISRWKKRLSIALQSVASPFVGFLGRVPFVNMNIKLTGGNLVLGIPLAAGTCLAFGSVITYALQQLIEEMLPLISSEQLRLMSHPAPGLHPAVRGVLFVISLFLGFSTQIPFAYAAHKYNAHPWDKIAPGAVFIVDVWLPAYSSYKLLEMGCHAMRQVLCPATELGVFGLNQDPSVKKKFSALLIKMQETLEKSERILVDSLPDVQSSIVTDFKNLSGRYEDKDNRQNLLELLYGNSGILKYASDGGSGGTGCCTSSQCCEKESRLYFLLRAILRMFGSSCAAMNLLLISTVANDETERLTGDDVLGYLAVCIYLVSSVFFSFYANNKMADMLTDMLVGRYEFGLPSKLLPKLSFCLHLIAFLSIAFSYGPSLEMVKDYMSPDRCGKPFSLIMSVTVCYATTGLIAVSIREMIDMTLRKFIRMKGSETEQTMLELKDKICQLREALAGWPLGDFVHHVHKDFPENLRNQLLEKVDLNITQLETMLNDEGEPTEDTPLLRSN